MMWCDGKQSDLAYVLRQGILLMKTSPTREYMLKATTVLTVILSCCSTVADPAKRITWNRPDVSDARLDLYRQCLIASGNGHFPLSSNRRHLFDNSSYKNHVYRLQEFCKAYTGNASTSFVKSIKREANVSSNNQFLVACQTEAKKGRSTLFRVEPKHIERMNGICETMARDLPQNFASDF